MTEEEFIDEISSIIILVDSRTTDVHTIGDCIDTLREHCATEDHGYGFHTLYVVPKGFIVRAIDGEGWIRNYRHGQAFITTYGNPGLGILSFFGS